MVVAIIKIVKFTSLRNATISFVVLILIELVYSIVLYVVNDASYGRLFLNFYNYPFQLQVPTINPVFNLKCSWLPFTVIIFPGMLFSYLRRFDSSRNNKLYIIISVITFILGGIAWLFLSIVSPTNLPFGLVSEPCMVALIALFAYRRR